MTDSTDNSTHFDNSDIVAGNIGGTANSGTVNASSTPSQPASTEALTATLESLRAELTELRTRLSAVSDSDAQSAEVDDLLDTLDAEPDIEQVTGLWARLLRHLRPSMAGFDGIDRIVDLVQRLQQLT